MPIKLPSNLPAYEVLSREGVMVMAEDAAARQDIRPLRIGLLNLMPKKIQTENQFARLIGATPLQIEFSLIRMSEHQTKNTAAEHMEEFYRPFSEVEATGEKFDGLIITGAPIEHLEFDEVTYLPESKRPRRSFNAAGSWFIYSFRLYHGRPFELTAVEVIVKALLL